MAWSVQLPNPLTVGGNGDVGEIDVLDANGNTIIKLGPQPQLTVTDASGNGVLTLDIGDVATPEISFSWFGQQALRMRITGSTPPTSVIEAFSNNVDSISFGNGFMSIGATDAAPNTANAVSFQIAGPASAAFPAVSNTNQGFGNNTFDNVQNTAGTTTSLSYTATLTGGTTCSFTFTGPYSTRALFFNNCRLQNNTGTATGWCSFEIRAGSVVGSGSIIQAASDNNAVQCDGVAPARYGITTFVTGLTAGSSYNARQMFKVDSGTGTFDNKEFIYQPQL